MTVKEYKLFKTAKKTAKENNLILIDGNNLSDNKMLFDFSFLDTLSIPENEKEEIKKEAMNHCSVANRTAFVIYNPDNWTVSHTIVDFNYRKVYDCKTGKRLYVIMEVKHVQYHHAERNSIYEKYYTENVKDIEVDSNTISPLNDIEI